MLLRWTNGTSMDGNIQRTIMEVKISFIYTNYIQSLYVALTLGCLKFNNKTQENCGKFK